MNWYKKAQSLSQGPSQSQSQLPDYGYGCALKQTDKLIKELGMEEILKKLGKEKGYDNAIDYVLCSLYPKQEKHCRAYYAGTGEQLIKLLTREAIRKMDDICAKAVLFFYYKYNKMGRK